MGEGLALEIASVGPSHNSVRLLAERKECFPAAGARPTPVEGGALGGGSGMSLPSVPADIGKINTPLELDEDMMNDVVVLANMQRGERLDVQANAATAAAGLTTNGESAVSQPLLLPRRFGVVPFLLCFVFRRGAFAFPPCKAKTFAISLCP